MRLILSFIFLLSFSLHAKIKSMKGWELYYLEQNSEKSFVLVEGTNTLKKPNELKQNKMNLEQLEQSLANLDSKEFVALSNRFASLNENMPAIIKDRLNQTCLKNNLNCYLGE